MAAKITYQITPRNYEVIRDKIASILAEELPIQTAASEISEVWLERIIPFSTDEYPVVNVGYDGTAFDNHTTISKRGESEFFIDVMYRSASTDDDDGDKIASINAQRIAGIISYILSSAEYFRLDLAFGIVNSRLVTEIRMGKVDNQDATHTVVARVTLKVISNENVNSIGLTPVELEEIYSQIKINETVRGFSILID